jgi:hypothetical protein
MTSIDNPYDVNVHGDLSPTLTARVNELEKLFGDLLAIVKDFIEAQTEFAGRDAAA